MSVNPFAYVGEYCFQEPDHLPSPVGRQVLVGSVRHATMVPMLRRLGITHVCNCAAECSVPFGEYEEHDIEHMSIRAVDAEGYPILQNHLNQVLQFIGPILNKGTIVSGSGPSKSKVLFTCAAGRNRSVTLAVAVVFLTELSPLPNVVRRLFQRRPFILTNTSFRNQLAELAEAQGLLSAPSPLGALAAVDGKLLDGGHRVRHRL